MGEPLHGRVWVIAHRGASHDAPEHTYAAYDQAVTDGTDFLEHDLQMTRDGVLVCLHDPTVDRTSDGTGSVSELTLDELRALDFGSWFNQVNPDRAHPAFAGQEIVVFEEQLTRYRSNERTLRFHVETKFSKSTPASDISSGSRTMELELVRILEANELLNPDASAAPVVVQSFDPSSLTFINELTNDGVPTALLTPGPGPDALPPGVDIAAPNYRALLADPAYVERRHAQGNEVHTYTVDEPDQIRRLIEVGVDAIFTNRPGLLRQILSDEFPAWSARPADDRARRS
ncbi:MAG: glycerophosphodiester phosphodiesterase [Actinobacteria bacterium]|nr:glycerophosphodiester phosphodiesterase [Actinomycetota bacterium]